jgi:hypothetical protein
MILHVGDLYARICCLFAVSAICVCNSLLAYIYAFVINYLYLQYVMNVINDTVHEIEMKQCTKAHP